MDLIKATYARHSVRHYDGKPITGKVKKDLVDFIKKVNKESGLHIQLVTNEPIAFSKGKSKWSNFTGCVNYLAMVGPKGKDLKEKVGYYGEKVVLKAQQLGLNTCWAALTFKKVKTAYKKNKGEKFVLLIALGYGTTQGKKHESKIFSQVTPNRGKLPQWFIRGVKMALLAPTGKNKQGFTIEMLDDGKVNITNKSFCKDLDLGIVKYHFELGSGKKIK